MDAPKVFISYSHDSEEHKRWVRQLASDLRSARVDVTLDQWDLSPGQDVSAFMQRGITESSRVLLICSDDYVSKADGGVGGVGYERLVVTAELVEQIDTRKFLPILRGNTKGKIPAYLGPRLYVDFRTDEAYQESLDLLLRDIHDAPQHEKPPLGENPFSSAVSGSGVAPREASDTGRAPGGGSILDGEWFGEEEKRAREGFHELGGSASMELRFGLHSPVSKSQLELLSAVRASEIHTFGWPIGVTLENREEYHPRPFAEGIRATVSIDDGGAMGPRSFDHWACRENGDFYLLKTLFEDQRRKNEIFFNTRIVRVAESLLFASNLYEHLGVPLDAKLSARVSHNGFQGRALSSSNPNRHIFPAIASDDRSAAEVVTTVEGLRKDLPDHVIQVLEPLFMLFDFKSFDRKVYEEIIKKFRNGEVT